MIRTARALALNAAAARNVDGGTQRLGNKMACVPMLRRIPVQGLVFELTKSRRPASAPVRR